jgi:hypothetical protein
MRRHVLSLPAACAALALAGCTAVEIEPEPILPKPVIVPIPAVVGVVLTGEQRNYQHTETRSGVDWQVRLGQGQQRLAKEVFGALFERHVELPDLEAARGMYGLAAVFEPKVEQYSFATSKETGGDYFAVTIRYRINLYDPQLRLVDSYTLTGYGSSEDESMSSEKPLEAATRAAMRDAAAKVLTQFPDQAAGRKLANREPLEGEASPTQAASGGSVVAVSTVDPIPTVPVVDRPAPQ